MEFPFGDDRRHRHHHRRDDDEDEEQRYPPPNYHQGPPPPHSAFAPPVQHLSHEPNPEFGYSGPPPPAFRPPGYTYTHYDEPSYPPTSPGYGFDGPNPNPSVVHVSHEINRPPDHSHPHHHHHRPHFPSFFGHHDADAYLANKPTVRVYTKAETNYSLAIRDGKVILTRSDPNDVFQQWIKDEKYSTRVKDEEGFPSFALVNKGTGQAMKHSIGATHPVQLIPYNPDTLDESILWAESRDLGDGYRTIRMVNNIRLNLDAFNGDKEHGGVHEGTILVLWEWAKGANQRWKIVPY